MKISLVIVEFNKSFLKIGKILENTIFMACNPLMFYKKNVKNGPKVDTTKNKTKTTLNTIYQSYKSMIKVNRNVCL